ncbi:MAG: response regulator [Synechococcales bacterium]|nr:response regulator [Synechococcales bacterium]
MQTCSDAPKITNPLRILLVEDDYLLAEGTARLLTRVEGYAAKVADHPQEVMQQCEAGQVDVVILDAHLPETVWNGQSISGRDLAQSLKANPKTCHIPILLVATLLSGGDRSQLLGQFQADAVYPHLLHEPNQILTWVQRLYYNRFQRLHERSFRSRLMAWA